MEIAGREINFKSKIVYYGFNGLIIFDMILIISAIIFHGVFYAITGGEDVMAKGKKQKLKRQRELSIVLRRILMQRRRRLRIWRLRERMFSSLWIL